MTYLMACVVASIASLTLMTSSLAGQKVIPLGLPDPPVQTDMDTTSDLAYLGRLLFNDARLSANGQTSCAKCHRADRAFSDGRRTAAAKEGGGGTRNTPSLLNVAYAKNLFWDGRISVLEEQVRAPLFNPLEQGLRDDRAVEDILHSLPEYANKFKKIFGTDGTAITTDQVTRAIAAYERTLMSGDSPFDRFLYGHDAGALSPKAQRGLALFRGRAGCAQCHLIGPSSALFTDQQFHFSSVRLPPEVSRDLPALTSRVIAVRRQNDAQQLHNLIEADTRIAALGRFLATTDPADIGKFQTPSLRNVALTAPYMHDGSIATLASVVETELYSRNTGIQKPIVLTVAEQADVVTFLQALSGVRLRPTR